MLWALKWILRILLGVVGLALIFSLLLSLLILRWPSLVFNPNTLPYWAKLGMLVGIDVRWKESRLEILSLSWFEKEISLGFDGVCVKRKLPPEFEGCFDYFQLAGRVDFSRRNFFTPKIEKLGPGELLGGSGRLSAWPKGERREKRGPKTLDFPRILTRASIEPIHVELRKFDLPDIRGAIDLRVGKSPPMSPQVLFRGEAIVDEIHHVSARGELNLKPVSRRAFVVEHDIEAKIRSGGTRIDIALDGTLSGSSLDTAVRGKGEGLWDPLPWLSTPSCLLHLDEARATLGCPTVVLPLAFIPPEIRSLRLFPHQNNAQLNATFTTSNFPPDLDQVTFGDIEASVLSLGGKARQDLLQGKGTVRAKVSGAPSRFPESWKMDSEVDWTFTVPRFSSFVEQLDGTDWAIPAPFRALDGKILLHSVGQADLISGRFPFRVETRLRSSQQRLELSSEGIFDTFGWEFFKASGEALFQNILLQLPRLAFAVPPRFLPDPRFQSLLPDAQEEEDQAGRLPELGAKPPESPDFEITVRTPPKNPIYLLSNLAKSPVPIFLDLFVTRMEPPAGILDIRRVPLELFRRRATLERLRLLLQRPLNNTEIEGSVEIEYADYIVKVHLLGTVGKPLLRLSSDPPLPENQLWAALLFGRPLEELDLDESSSVANTRAAITEGALSLASLYLLASTPIQSLSYDPATGIFSMKVRLAEGTSLNVGGGTEEGVFQQLGIRKRLGAHWTLSTDIYRGSEEAGDESNVSTFLEWHNRY